MSDSIPSAFEQDRSQTYDHILKTIQSHVDAVPMSLVITPGDLSPETAKNDSIRVAWGLLAKGIQHLKDGAPGGQPGSMAGALARSTLRASPLAVSIGIRPPQFEDALLDVQYKTGHEEAVFLTRRLIDAVEGDIPKSTQIIRLHIHREDMSRALAPPDNSHDAELRKIFEIVRAATGASAPDLPKPSDKTDGTHLKDLRQQTLTSFSQLVESFREACETLRQDIGVQPQPVRPRSSIRPGNFTL